MSNDAAPAAEVTPPWEGLNAFSTALGVLGTLDLVGGLFSALIVFRNGGNNGAVLAVMIGSTSVVSSVIFFSFASMLAWMARIERLISAHGEPDEAAKKRQAMFAQELAAATREEELRAKRLRDRAEAAKISERERAEAEELEERKRNWPPKE